MAIKPLYPPNIRLFPTLEGGTQLIHLCVPDHNMKHWLKNAFYFFFSKMLFKPNVRYNSEN